LVRVRAGAYFIVGSDKDDIIQEGMIGLLKSIRDFNPASGTPFKAFAEICINRQMISAVKAGARKKHMPLNSSTPLDTQPRSEKSGPDPEQLLISREHRHYIGKHLASALSSMELQVLKLHLQGLSYAEIAEHTNRNIKAIDNAMQRVRRKAEKLLKNS
jgi:RNA polymerase sporulation-specific sigma factor